MGLKTFSFYKARVLAVALAGLLLSAPLHAAPLDATIKLKQAGQVQPAIQVLTELLKAGGFSVNDQFRSLLNWEDSFAEVGRLDLSILSLAAMQWTGLFVNRGRALARQGRLYDALVSYGNTLSLKQDKLITSIVHVHMGFAYMQDKQVDKGVESLQSGPELTSGYSSPITTKVWPIKTGETGLLSLGL